ncbi:MAG: hypothetical protein JXB35_06125 [Anaerolineae bacterium]|nr:hypothetical protein [Anaerolineae bacterium]
MCGLAGTLLYPQPRPAETWQRLRETFTANLLANEERGREAAGVAVIQRTGDYALFKQPATASELVEMPGYRETLARLNEETVAVLGHTRMPTKGSRWHNANNHPVVAGHVIGIHNGVIDNDDLLFESLKLPRTAEVDSEIIFRLQDLADPSQTNGNYNTCLQQRIDQLTGRFATLSTDVRKPTQLLALKYLRPLCLHYEPGLQALFFSSRYIFLRRAFGRSVITEALDTGFGFCFDALRLPELGSEPAASFPINPISCETCVIR